MSDLKNPTNLPEFDLDVYEVASRLKQNPVDALEIAVEASKQMTGMRITKKQYELVILLLFLKVVFLLGIIWAIVELFILW